MSSELRIEKLLELPVQSLWTPSTLYLVSNVSLGGHLDVYLTSSDASTIKRFLNNSDVSTMIASSLQSFSSIRVVNTIAERNALITGAPGNGFNTATPSQVLVITATADPTVLTGGATYIWEPVTQAWIKISEYESLDLVLNWSSMVGGPTSTVAQIDDAVAKTHAHANKTVLDALDSSNGKLTYNGKPIRAFLDSEQW